MRERCLTEFDMNAEFFQSWKGSLAIAAIITIAIGGYKTAFQPDLATRIAERRIAAAFPDGQPSEGLRSRVVIENMTLLNLHFTLDELERFLTSSKAKIAWEPQSERSFILRGTRYDPLTQVTNEYAFQMQAREASDLPTLDPQFKSGAIAVTAFSLNSKMADPQVTQNLLFQMESDISAWRQQRDF